MFLRGGFLMLWEYVKAFLAGGLLCVIGQVLIDKTRLTPAKILVSYVVAGVLLGAVGVYGPFADWAGAGASIPLTGFGYTLAVGIKEAVAEYGALGVLTGGLTAAAAGVSAAIIFGYIVALVFKPHEKP
jgi:stage V sporulation protein AE